MQTHMPTHTYTHTHNPVCLLFLSLSRNEEYLSPGKAKAMQRLCEDLCSELRGVAVQLVDAFAIPDIILRAPIGLSADGTNNIYKDYLNAAGFKVT